MSSRPLSSSFPSRPGHAAARRLLFLALFLLPLLIFFPHLDAFAFPPASPYSDIVVSHFPNTLYLQRSIRDLHIIPLWSPLILSGYPFFANPLSGLHYPPGWLALLFPLPHGFNITILLHLVLGGWGMYRFLRLEGLEEAPALFGALAFEALPKLNAHLAAGHLTLLYAICWTPWLLAAARRSASLPRLRPVLPGLVLGIIALADMRWAALAGLFWLAFSLRECLNHAGVWRVFSRSARSDQPCPRFPAAALRSWLGTTLTNSAFALLFAAPLLLPLIEYTHLSTRAHLTPAESLIESLPISQLLGLFYPVIGGAVEHAIYPGVVILILGIYALTMPLVRRRIGFWLLAAGFSLLFAMGSNLPLVGLLFRLPGLSLLRVPSRALFITGFCLVVIAGYALQSLVWRIQGREWLEKDRSMLAVFAVSLFVTFLGAAAWFYTDQPLARIQFAWGAVFAALAALVIALARSRRLSLSVLFVSLLGLGLADAVSINGLSLSFRSLSDVLSPGQIPVLYMQSKSPAAPFRVYSPSYSISQQVGAWFGVEQADGVDPLQLSAYTRFMQRATGVPFAGYSVTLPPFPSDSPATDNQSFTPGAELLGLLNVRFVTSEFEIPASRLTLLARLGQIRIYENPLVMPRAWVQSPDAPVGTILISTPPVDMQPNRVSLQASGPGLLVLSELAYPGWQVRIDNSPAPVETVGGLFRGVRLPPGAHTVVFRFRPVSLYLGLLLSAVAWVILLALLWLRFPLSKRGQ